MVQGIEKGRVWRGPIEDRIDIGQLNSKIEFGRIGLQGTQPRNHRPVLVLSFDWHQEYPSFYGLSSPTCNCTFQWGAAGSTGFQCGSIWGAERIGRSIIDPSHPIQWNRKGYSFWRGINRILRKNRKVLSFSADWKYSKSWRGSSQPRRLSWPTGRWSKPTKCRIN